MPASPEQGPGDRRRAERRQAARIVDRSRRIETCDAWYSVKVRVVARQLGQCVLGHHGGDQSIVAQQSVLLADGRSGNDVASRGGQCLNSDGDDGVNGLTEANELLNIRRMTVEPLGNSGIRPAKRCASFKRH